MTYGVLGGTPFWAWLESYVSGDDLRVCGHAIQGTGEAILIADSPEPVICCPDCILGSTLKHEAEIAADKTCKLCGGTSEIFQPLAIEVTNLVVFANACPACYEKTAANHERVVNPVPAILN
jgi:hypothetical protein